MNKKKIIAYINFALAAYLLILSFFYLTSTITTYNVIFLIYSGLVFLVIGTGLLFDKIIGTIYIVSYLTVVMLMSYLSLLIIDISDLDPYLVGLLASLLGVGLLVFNEHLVKKIMVKYSKKKL